MVKKKVGEKTEIILCSAIKVFAEEGYHNASISKIARNAGIGDGTVYLYFKNKEDILITLFHETIHNEFVPFVMEKLSHFEDARILLFELVSCHYDFFGRDEDLALVIQIESRQSSKSIRLGMKPGIIKHFRLIESIIKKGQEQGVFRTDITDRDARKMIFGTLDETVTCWVLSSKTYPLLRMIEPTYKLFIQSLLVR